MEQQSIETAESHLNMKPKMAKSASISYLPREQRLENGQTVSGLKQELGELRESTKDALKQSWAENEQLKEKSAAHLQRANSLERELEILRSREQKLMRRCEEQMATIEMYKRREEKIQRTNEEGESQTVITTKSTKNQQATDSSAELPKKERRGSMLRSMLSRRHSLLSQNSLHKISITSSMHPDESEHMMVEQSGSKTYPRSDEYWREMSEEIINSVICPSSDRMEMEAKLTLLLKNIDGDRQRELATVIEVYRKRVNSKKKIIMEQREKLSDYKNYIMGLTNELERVCSGQDEDNGPKYYRS